MQIKYKWNKLQSKFIKYIITRIPETMTIIEIIENLKFAVYQRT